MKLVASPTLIALGLAISVGAPTTAWAQYSGQACVPTPSITTPVPAPGTGSVSIEPLTKFNYPAQICTTVGFTGSSISFDYAASAASRFNATTYPSGCAGVTYGLNGGPVYSYIAGKGNFAFNLANPTAAVTGTLQATIVTLIENLTLSFGGASYTINTDALQYKAFVTINADQSSDTKICTPRGGIPVRVNGAPVTVSTPVWSCLSQPGLTQPKARVTYEEGC